MNTFNVVVKSADRIRGNAANFDIKFEHILPSDKQSFKCRVAALNLELSNLLDVRNAHNEEVRAIYLSANFPFINYHSTNSTSLPIMLINYTLEYGTFDFIISNINYQTINFRFLDNIDEEIQGGTITESLFVLTFETLS